MRGVVVDLEEHGSGRAQPRIELVMALLLRRELRSRRIVWRRRSLLAFLRLGGQFCEPLGRGVERGGQVRDRGLQVVPERIVQLPQLLQVGVRQVGVLEGGVDRRERRPRRVQVERLLVLRACRAREENERQRQETRKRRQKRRR